MFFDATEGQGKLLSHVIDLSAVEHLEVDDRHFDLRQLELRGLKDLRLYREPGFLKTLMYKMKWWLEDREARKAVRS